MDFDSSWCPVCDRQILPKRYQVPVAPPQPSTPVPPPSSPQSSPTKSQRPKVSARRRQGGGLVQGTGRLKPNGTIKRTDSITKPAPQPPAKPAAPIKTRTVIDQGPIPLYCSDACQLADIHALNRGLPINPNREHASPCTRTNTFSMDGSDLESDATGSSVQSTSSTSSTATPSIAKLAAFLNFPPLPPPAPTYVDDSNSDSEPLEYNSGIMMAGRLIDSLCPKPAKEQAHGNYRVIPEPRAPVAGWTDGSNAWRASVYSFSSQKLSRADDSTKPYSTVPALSHRSRGTHSQFSAPTPTNHTASLPSSSTDMLAKFSESFNRRSELRSALHSPPSPTSPDYPATAPCSQKRERSLLRPGAEGKLLVPDVKLKVNSASSASLSSAWSGPATASSRRSVRSPLSSTMSDFSDEEAQATRYGSATSLPHQAKRPVVETRSWSYDNLRTYPIMKLPPKIVKRMERQIVDGVEVEVEIEEVVEEPRKRLFLFPAPIRCS
ncbi:uncharacterized protein LACBIDRAFT_292504 [Laccaria bicolor S238N-H82]|uniref:Predicted protein n=1 Tax=Laccaria bicolor (strain S238N-H82 / ATCC MYA-4686) TaxID=486041 RepID=B0CV63_LACBS|nr:uncharacterized protein LACBIDRAFT_292504 [Laccaria bicolor S238N-H82]EDR13693.1 predicted protein [Laccaria bicolor S238N-H82]|eukprot:XP_001876191.1 predicted protein [Laccaria bicolor S238N-H82]